MSENVQEDTAPEEVPATSGDVRQPMLQSRKQHRKQLHP